MKIGKKMVLFSLAVLALVGIGLYLWAYYPGQREAALARQQEAEARRMQEQGLGLTSEILQKEDERTQGTGSSAQGEDAAKDKEDGDKESQQEGQGFDEKDEGLAGEQEAEEEPSMSDAREVTLVYAGDIYLSSYVQENFDREGVSGVISDQLLSEMKNGDIVMVNQEFPFSLGGSKAPDKQFNFRVDPAYAKLFNELGIDVVALANNHALDYGAEALTDTFAVLDAADIAYVGAGDGLERAMQPAIQEAGQRKFGFLSASRVIPEIGWNIENRQPGMLCTYDSGLLCQAIQEAKEQCEFLTVYVHWGIEKSSTPEEYQKQLAHKYIDAGADLVIGTHPHVLQGIEYYNGKPIVYSLGNYIFNQQIVSTALLKVRVTTDNQAELQFVAAYASGAKTQEMTDEQAKELYRRLDELSVGAQVGEDGIVRPAP